MWIQTRYNCQQWKVKSKKKIPQRIPWFTDRKEDINSRLGNLMQYFKGIKKKLLIASLLDFRFKVHTFWLCKLCWITKRCYHDPRWQHPEKATLLVPLDPTRGGAGRDNPNDVTNNWCLFITFSEVAYKIRRLSEASCISY